MQGIHEEKLPLVPRRAFKQGTDGCSLQEGQWVKRLMSLAGWWQLTVP